jgi:hypothetical protein
MDNSKGLFIGYGLQSVWTLAEKCTNGNIMPDIYKVRYLATVKRYNRDTFLAAVKAHTQNVWKALEEQTNNPGQAERCRAFVQALFYRGRVICQTELKDPVPHYLQGQVIDAPHP